MIQQGKSQAKPHDKLYSFSNSSTLLAIPLKSMQNICVANDFHTFHNCELCEVKAAKVFVLQQQQQQEQVRLVASILLSASCGTWTNSLLFTGNTWNFHCHSNTFCWRFVVECTLSCQTAAAVAAAVAVAAVAAALFAIGAELSGHLTFCQISCASIYTEFVDRVCGRMSVSEWGCECECEWEWV